jgi:hypothetical protein
MATLDQPINPGINDTEIFPRKYCHWKQNQHILRLFLPTTD